MTMNMIDRLISEHAPTDRGGWVASVEAHKILAEARQTTEGQSALAEWMDEHAEYFLASWITARRPRNARSRSAQMKEKLAWYEQIAVSGNVVKMASEMTKLDHEYVARRHGMTSRTSAMLEAFHQAVADKLTPDQVTADIFTPDTYEAMLTSITGVSTGAISQSQSRPAGKSEPAA